MKLTTNELTLFRNYLLAKRAYRNTAIPLQPRIWEEWMDGTLDKLTDELYPCEGDQI